MDYTERLRRLAINDELLTEGVAASALGETEIDPKILALARIAALVAMGGAAPSFGSQIDAAVSAGASTTEIVDVLVGVADVVGMPRAVAAAPKVAAALGHDLYDDDAGTIAGPA